MKYNLFKLTNSNFNLWLEALKAAYKGEDIDDLLLEATAKPEPTANNVADVKAWPRTSHLAADDLQDDRLTSKPFRPISELCIMEEIHKWQKSDTVDTFININRSCWKANKDGRTIVPKLSFHQSLVNREWEKSLPFHQNFFFVKMDIVSPKNLKFHRKS